MGFEQLSGNDSGPSERPARRATPNPSLHSSVLTVRRNAPDLIPVSIIGRLAVSPDHAGKGLGADLLADALRRIAVASQSIGIGAVLVQAKDEAAKRFHLRCAEFIEYPEDSRTLFLPVETVVAAFG